MLHRLFPHWSISCFLPPHVNSYWLLWTLPCQKVPICTPQGSPPPSPLPPAGLYIFSQFPQTLTAAGAEVWVGAHYFSMELCQKEGRVFKGSKVRFSFFGLLYFIWANPTVVWSVPCVVCVPPAVFPAPFTLQITSALIHLMNSPLGCAYLILPLIWCP